MLPWFIILPIMWYFIGFNARPHQTLPFPHLTDFQLSDIGKPIHIFEGIDYDKLPPNIKEQYEDCYDDRNRCLRVHTHMNPVCGYSVYWKSYYKFTSICELNLENCLKMTQNYRQNFTKYGIHYWNREIFYVGEGYTCEYYVRRFQDRMKTDNMTIVNATSV